MKTFYKIIFYPVVFIIFIGFIFFTLLAFAFTYKRIKEVNHES